MQRRFGYGMNLNYVPDILNNFFVSLCAVKYVYTILIDLEYMSLKIETVIEGLPLSTHMQSICNQYVINQSTDKQT